MQTEKEVKKALKSLDLSTIQQLKFFDMNRKLYNKVCPVCKKSWIMSVQKNADLTRLENIFCKKCIVMAIKDYEGFIKCCSKR